jgi:sterol desaturase/sphingolipid hydroxylase (fatty acid hydroxylase superfamily)
MGIYNPVIFSIPLFAILIAIETVAAKRIAPQYYDRRDTWTNIAVGLVSVLFGLVFGLFTGVIYAVCYSLAPYKFPENAWWSWVILFLLDDFAYYVFHRISHESRFFWNFHVVHHSSEFYNLSVAVRQSWFSGFVHWIFYAPIMLLGFAPWMFAVMHGANLIYQFWLHTRFIGRLGPLELVLNTPSHHRVHHGVNNPYLDKNYAGVLIIWDRLFKTFTAESEDPKYGIIKPLKSHNLLWINSHGWFEMAENLRKSTSFKEKLKSVFGSPYFKLD